LPRDPGKPELVEWLGGEGAGVPPCTFAQTAAFGELEFDVYRCLGDWLFERAAGEER
jgi:hypothetical protein